MPSELAFEDTAHDAAGNLKTLELVVTELVRHLLGKRANIFSSKVKEEERECERARLVAALFKSSGRRCLQGVDLLAEHISSSENLE